MNDRPTCPVCGYDRLIRPQKYHMICPCCGTEFGYDDAAASHEELRREWVEAGAKWFSETTSPPPDWNPVTQLLQAGYPLQPVSVTVTA